MDSESTSLIMIFVSKFSNRNAVVVITFLSLSEDSIRMGIIKVAFNKLILIWIFSIF